jgi:hypothetical protein
MRSSALAEESAGQQRTRLRSGAPQLHHHHNRERARPCPRCSPRTRPTPPVRRPSGAFERDLLGGLPHEYHRAAAWAEVLHLPALDDLSTQRPAPRPETSVQHYLWMTSIAGIVALVVVLVPLAIVGAVFVWGARKDGAEDKALQARLGIRRKTRLGR